MELFELLQTISALFGIALILIGSGRVKAHVKDQLFKTSRY